jgi:hypothetical protein
MAAVTVRRESAMIYDLMSQSFNWMPAMIMVGRLHADW